jgi:hypothetical protein
VTKKWQKFKFLALALALALALGLLRKHPIVSCDDGGEGGECNSNSNCNSRVVAEVITRLVGPRLMWKNLKKFSIFSFLISFSTTY